MIPFLRIYLSHRAGATAIEYALLAAGIALSIVTAVGLLGDELSTLFDTVKTDLENL